MSEETGKSTKKAEATPAAAEGNIPAPVELRKLKVPALRKLCTAKGLPFTSKTKKDDLIGLLDSKARGGDGGGFIAGKTLCKYCSSPVRVVGTTRTDGFVVRKLRCAGKRAHRYSHWEPLPE